MKIYVLLVSVLFIGSCVYAQHTNNRVVNSNTALGPLKPQPIFLTYSSPDFGIKEKYHDSIIGYKFYNSAGNVLTKSSNADNISFTLVINFEEVYSFVGDLYKNGNLIRRQFSFKHSGNDEWIEQDYVSGKKTVYKEFPLTLISSDSIMVVDPETGQELWKVQSRYKVVAQN